jgi:hypothetical protein
MKSKLQAICAATALAMPLSAHHSFSAEFDSKRPIKLEGKVTSMEWVNPHSWIHIEVTAPDGTVTKWMVECGPPGVMIRRGFSKSSLQEGAEISVQGYQAKNGENRANGSLITFKDGRKLFVGGSNPDDPDNTKK